MSLGMVGLIDDVAPGGGAFTVWRARTPELSYHSAPADPWPCATARSHRRIFPTFMSQYSDGSITTNDQRPAGDKAEYFRVLREINEDTAPVDCFGHAGE